MKKIFVYLFALLLSCCLAFAQAEAAPLTVDDLVAFCDDLLALALTEEPEQGELDEETELYCFDFGSYLLYAAEDTLTADTRVLRADVYGLSDALPALHGVTPGMTLADVLAAFPLDNTDLHGSYEQAALYIDDDGGETLRLGWLFRAGSHVDLVEHELYIATEDAAEYCWAAFSLIDNRVDSVSVRLNAPAEPQQRADALEALSALQEENAYAPYQVQEPQALAREDLFFGPIDFVSANADALIAFLGEPQADTWEELNELNLRILEWEDVTAVLAYDAEKQNNSLMGIQVYGEALEGPRSLHMEDSVDSVLARLPQESRENADAAGVYGLMDAPEDGLRLQYAVPLEDMNAVLSLDFLDGRLILITCAYE